MRKIKKSSNFWLFVPVTKKLKKQVKICYLPNRYFLHITLTGSSRDFHSLLLVFVTIREIYINIVIQFLNTDIPKVDPYASCFNDGMMFFTSWIYYHVGHYE